MRGGVVVSVRTVWLIYISILVVVAVTPCAVRAGEITRGPYLQDVREDGVIVAWEGTGFSGPVVVYGETSVEESSAPASCVGVHCHVTLSGLAPDSHFLYEVRDGTGPLAPAGTFLTAPDWPRPFRFVVFGDNRSDHASHSMVVDMMLAEEFDLVINTGDMVSDGEVEDQWDVFFGIEADLFHSRPFYPAVGNHEEHDGAIPIVERLFHTPAVTSGSGQMSYYSFDYGNVHFVVIDDFVHVLPWYLCALLGKLYDNCFTADQEAWIKADLAAAAADPEVEHVFIVVHEGPYSSKEHRTGSAAMRALLPTFATSKVRIIFSGHDHIYEHGISGNGLHYVVTGGGGAPLYDSTPDIMNQMFPHEILMVESVHNFQIVEVAGEWVKMSTWDVDNAAIIDEIELGTSPACVSPEDCVAGEAGSCDGAWDCIEFECVWVCAPPPACETPADCPAPSEDACPGNWECTPEGTCLWVCTPEPECLDDAGCQDKPPLSDCVDGAFQCTDGACEWVCPPPLPPDTVEDIGAMSPDIVASPDLTRSDLAPSEEAKTPSADTNLPMHDVPGSRSGGCTSGPAPRPVTILALVFLLMGIPGSRRRGSRVEMRRKS